MCSGLVLCGFDFECDFWFGSLCFWCYICCFPPYFVVVCLFARLSVSMFVISLCVCFKVVLRVFMLLCECFVCCCCVCVLKCACCACLLACFFPFLLIELLLSVFVRSCCVGS